MPRSGVDNTLIKTPAMLEADERGRLALVAYCGKRRGQQARLCMATGIDKGALSKMCGGGYGIGLEVALILEVATAGALKAEVLCPSRANLLSAMLRQRYG